MTRVSLKEAYDNKDVVAQIYAIRDIAEGVEDTANSALSTANTASEHVDALVPQVEGAVQNANNASASAQASAQTVAGYDGRLSALESADVQNVKLTGDQTITGIKTVPTTATSVRDTQIANGTRIQNDLAAYAPMVRTTGNQDIGGVKTFIETITIKSSNIDRNNPPESTAYMQQIAFTDANGIEVIRFIPTYESDGVPHLYLVRYKQNGTSITTELGV